MVNAERARPNYVTIWAWLVFLLIVSLLAVYLPFSPAATMSIIFSVALAKAALVAANYMHLRFEKGLIHAIAIVPVLLFVILTLALLPDIVYNR